MWLSVIVILIYQHIRIVNPAAGQGLSAAPVTPYDGPMQWTKDGSSLEIRTQGKLADGRPALDEIVADGASIHLEQMAYDSWFMGIEAGGQYLHLNFTVNAGKLHVHLSDQGSEDAEWEGDNRERPFPGD
jgi:hypothetical protein